MRFEQVPVQAHSLSPQLVLSAKLLQMGAQELRDYAAQEALENPVLELTEPPAGGPAAPAAQELSWLDSCDRQDIYYLRQDSEDGHRDLLAGQGQVLDEEAELDRYILSQFLGMDLGPQVGQAIRFLIRSLDEDGFLDEELDALTARSGLPRWAMDRALIELQAAEPAGVGARDLAECLCLQLQRRSGDHSLAAAIVKDHLEDLAKGRCRQIAKALGADLGQVRAACDLIRSLDPHPATGFASHQALPYLIPDVTVAPQGDHFELSLNTAAIPRLSLDPYYLRLLQETTDPEVRAYLSERAERAKAVVKGISRRHDTLLRCTRSMVERQISFFRQGPGHLVPLTMEQTAAELGLHVSTVSRAVKDKYFQCQWGVYPLNYLFSRSLSAPEVSTESAKVLLQALIAQEDTPLSDQKLCEEMARQGCPISRRTVAKYREALGIPGAAARKR